jgi:hypothetical protein
MISTAWQKDDGQVAVQTTGCGCCSVELHIPEDTEQIENELRITAKKFVDVCKLLGKDPIRYVAFFE